LEIAMFRKLPLLVLLCVLALLGACAAATPVPRALRPAQPQLRIYNWDTYIDPALISAFEQQFGVSVLYSTYSSNEELYAAVSANPSGYDIIVPSEYMVSIMRREGLLAPLDQAALPNLGNIDPLFVNPAYDPGGRYCAPYQWGTQGIGYNLKATGRPISSWGDLLSPQFAGRSALLADSRSTIGAALIYLGYSPNTTRPSELHAARDLLREHIKTLRLAPDTGQDLLAAGEVDLTYEWSGDIFQVMEQNPDLRYVIPEEGSIIWIDSMCILKDSPNSALAQSFINYIFEPKVGAALSNYTHFSTPNLAALPLIDAADRENPALYPDDEMRKRLFFLVDLGSDGIERYNQAWAEVLAAR
jgi:spermidine/putrescine transport system substrate-binding protein